jgi:hypothetical protein
MPVAATPTSSRWCFPDHQLKFMTTRIAPKDANVGVFSGFFPEQVHFSATSTLRHFGRSGHQQVLEHKHSHSTEWSHEPIAKQISCRSIFVADIQSGRVKVDLGCLMELFSKAARKELETSKGVRTKFAHRVARSFSFEGIRDLANNLSLSERVEFSPQCIASGCTRQTHRARTLSSCVSVLQRSTSFYRLPAEGKTIYYFSGIAFSIVRSIASAVPGP